MITHYWSFTAFRMMVSSIFIVSGYGHLFSPEKLVMRLTQSPGWSLLSVFFNPTILIILTGVILLSGGLALFFNIKIRLAAIVLILVLIPITLTVQTGGGETIGPFFKNIAILGSLILVSSNDFSRNLKGVLK